MKFKFVCEEHKEYGTRGWRPMDMPDFDPLMGMGVAHDCLEHSRRSSASVADELQAFGAMIHVRGSQYFHLLGKANCSPAYHMSYEIAEMLRKIEFGELEDIVPHGITRCPEIEDELNSAIEYIRDLVQEDFSGEFEVNGDTERNIRAWLTVGYRKAKKRYQRVDVLSMFRVIEMEADRYLKGSQEGDMLTVSVIKGNVKVSYGEYE